MCSVVKRDSGKPGFLHTQHASTSQRAALQQAREDVDLDEVLHYLPDLTLFGGEKKKKNVSGRWW